MTELQKLPIDKRKGFFEIAADELQLPTEIVEKDFWVVWALNKLFSIKELKSHLTFKGGTSLSKVSGLIDRFSEDIDLSIEKEFFGFNESNDPEKAKSKNKQKAFIENLSQKCSNYVQNELFEKLHEMIKLEMGNSKDWKLFLDTNDPDEQTIQFSYPTNASVDSYIKPSVKIEMGARSEHWPVSQHKIQSYAKTALKEKIEEKSVSIRVLGVERTFWEKATILHQYTHFPEAKNLPPRISRHYYDFYCLLVSSVKSKAMEEWKLLERVAIHKGIYFSSSWAHYQTARKGSLKLIPGERIKPLLERDFIEMKSMFFRDIPKWDLILKTIHDFEKEFNK